MSVARQYLEKLGLYQRDPALADEILAALKRVELLQDGRLPTGLREVGKSAWHDSYWDKVRAQSADLERRNATQKALARELGDDVFTLHVPGPEAREIEVRLMKAGDEDKLRRPPVFIDHCDLIPHKARLSSMKDASEAFAQVCAEISSAKRKEPTPDWLPSVATRLGGGTFMLLYREGIIEADRINDYIECWHLHVGQDGNEEDITDYLGLTPAEYKHWVETDQLPPVERTGS